MAQFTAKMQKAFVHFAEHRNKSEAYRWAYNCEKMKEESIRVKAWELFEHPLMTAAISSMMASAAVKVQIDAAWVLERAARLADFNINRFISVEEGGIAVYDFSKATDDDWYCISEYTVKNLVRRSNNVYTVEGVKLKTACKLRALELVGKHTEVQAFREQLSLSGPGGAPLTPRSLSDFYRDNTD